MASSSCLNEGCLPEEILSYKNIPNIYYFFDIRMLYIAINENFDDFGSFNILISI
ncbi:hypothetical protein OsccyDRAFT_3376 [Leptolyngbyaceae cyanobacterium JSC-12]|nr:hypothetical protein OsccyDRAFT_3376 [Leptolyngbyaceae cyanobacterium JSC-12]